jgi:hypothetical protein
MYETFQACRLGGTRAGPALDALGTMLERVEQTGALELDEHDDAIAAAMSWFRTAMPGRLTSSELPPWTGDGDWDLADHVALTLRNQDLFHIIAVGKATFEGSVRRGRHLPSETWDMPFTTCRGYLQSQRNSIGKTTCSHSGSLRFIGMSFRANCITRSVLF